MTEEHPTYHERIVCDPAVMAGKPVVKGTRIPVERVIAHLAHTPDLADLFAAYPELTIEDVKACLQYAHTVLEFERYWSAPASQALPHARARRATRRSAA